jgi:hypothetical protein
VAAGPLGRTGSGRWQKARGQGAGAAAIGPCSSESFVAAGVPGLCTVLFGIGACQCGKLQAPVNRGALVEYPRRRRGEVGSHNLQCHCDATLLASLVSACHAAVSLCRPAATWPAVSDPAKGHAAKVRSGQVRSGQVRT